MSQPSTSVDREPQKDRGRDRGVEIAAEEALLSASEGPDLIGAGREGVLGASGGRERDCFGGGWLYCWGGGKRRILIAARLKERWAWRSLYDQTLTS